MLSKSHTNVDIHSFFFPEPAHGTRHRDVIRIDVVFTFIVWYMKAIDVVTMITVIKEPVTQLFASVEGSRDVSLIRLALSAIPRNSFFYQ